MMANVTFATLVSRLESAMPEVSSTEAAQILGVSRQTIIRYIDRQLIPARKQGLRGISRIELEDLQRFAEEYQYRYDEKLARRLAK